MATQGKCPHCRVRYVFPIPTIIPLRKLRCPRCGTVLKPTSHLSWLPVEVCHPVIHYRGATIHLLEVSRE